MKRRTYRKQSSTGPLLDQQRQPTLMLDLGQARTELRLLRIENQSLREQKNELGRLRAKMAEHFYGLSLLCSG